MKSVTLEEIVAQIGLEMKELTKSHRELTKSQRELTKSQKETDRILKEQAIETDLYLKEQDAKLSKHIRETLHSFSRFGQSIGALVEFIVIPGMRPLMREYGHHYDSSVANKKVKVSEQEIAELDMFLDNSKEAMAVEVKTRLRISDVKEHIQKLKNLRANANAPDINISIQNKKLYGAIVGLFIDDIAQELAQKEGLYVVQIVEDSEKLEILQPVDKVRAY